jgi:hypothetical protein
MAQIRHRNVRTILLKQAVNPVLDQLGVTQPAMVLATGICSITPHHVGELCRGLHRRKIPQSP